MASTDLTPGLVRTCSRVRGDVTNLVRREDEGAVCRTRTSSLQPQLLSIIVPVLNEASIIAEALDALRPARRRGVEVIVVDGGSRDGTAALARPLADAVIVARQGRARQMNAGAAIAKGEVLLFLHADTRLPSRAEAMAFDALAGSKRVWGRFDVAICGRTGVKLVAKLMNLRSRITGIATGDQSMFVRRSAFEAVGGFPEIPLMEDVALSRRLKKLSRPICLAARTVTSGRRWESHGLVSTIVMMWGLRLGYFFGADPVRLARFYGYAARDE